MSMLCNRQVYAQNTLPRGLFLGFFTVAWKEKGLFEAFFNFGLPVRTPYGVNIDEIKLGTRTLFSVVAFSGLLIGNTSSVRLYLMLFVSIGPGFIYDIS